MDIKSILKKVGSAVIRDIIPGGGLVLDLINMALPQSKKLQKGATGVEARSAIDDLPTDKRLELLSKELDVEIEEIRGHTSVIEALAEVDKTGNTTRPEIANQQSWVMSYGVVIILSAVGWAIITADEKMTAVANAWPLVAAALGFPAAIVNSYFGKRHKEKAQKYEAVSSTPPVAGFISQVAKMFRR